MNIPFSEPEFTTSYQTIQLSDLLSNKEYKLEITPNLIILRDLLFFPEQLHYLHTFYSYFTFGNRGTGKTIVQTAANNILGQLNLITGDTQVTLTRDRTGLTTCVLKVFGYSLGLYVILKTLNYLSNGCKSYSAIRLEQIMQEVF